MVERISFRDEIQKNKIKSFALMLIIILILIGVGYTISLVFDPSYFFLIMILSIIISLSYTLISYYNADKIALASVNAKPASQTNHRAFIIATQNMSLASGLPMPKLYVMDSPQINAFASGRNPKNAIICVTQGTLEKLNKQELEGVIAHEMSHIANYDIRFMTFTAIAIGMISIMAELFLRSLWFSGGNRDRNGKSQVVLIIIGVALAIIAPLLVRLISLAISRKREFTADATGVKLTRYPPGLTSALKKIKNSSLSSEDKRKFPKAVAPLFISDPFKKKLTNMFSTHPNIDDRISKLERM
ncbi:M48 family metallopeptidase [Candidatus Pacearchaeota archaeon]|nr:M48 family metallopeptidase [Candidatus Pacearchaeota archaeon]